MACIRLHNPFEYFILSFVLYLLLLPMSVSNLVACNNNRFFRFHLQPLFSSRFAIRLHKTWLMKSGATSINSNKDILSVTPAFEFAGNVNDRPPASLNVTVKSSLGGGGGGVSLSQRGKPQNRRNKSDLGSGEFFCRISWKLA